jgi:predicted transposase/invertase (TIGR01784 family)
MCILDVKVHTTSGRVINVEIQVEPSPDVRKRVMYYSAGMLREQIRKGEDYRDISQVICIIITDYVLAPQEKDYFNGISMRYDKSGNEFTDVQKFITLELPKVPEHDDARKIWNWLKFIKSQSREELMEIAEKNPVLRKPVAILMELSEDERTRMIVEKQEIYRMDQSSRMRGAYTDGKAEGLQEGLKAGQQEGLKAGEEKAYQEKLDAARKMKSDGFSSEQIRKYTGFSPEEIDKL